MAVGGIETGGLDEAAQLGVLGLDPLLFLTTEDSFERGLMVELGKRMNEYQQAMNKNLAIEIANAVGKMLFGK